MDAVSKKQELAKIPTRKLLSSLKLEIQKQIQAAPSARKSKKSK